MADLNQIAARAESVIGPPRTEVGTRQDWIDRAERVAGIAANASGAMKSATRGVSEDQGFKGISVLRKPKYRPATTLYRLQGQTKNTQTLPESHKRFKTALNYIKGNRSKLWMPKSAPKALKGSVTKKKGAM